MKKIEIISIHEHEILIYFPNVYKLTNSGYLLLKNNGSFYLYSKEKCELFIKCQKRNCDINPSKTLFNDSDQKLFNKLLSKYNEDPNVKKDIIFSLSDYYRLNLDDSFEDKIFLGTKAEKKEYLLKGYTSNQYNPYFFKSDKIAKVINFLDEINEKRIKVLEEQKAQIKSRLKITEEQKEKLNLQNQKINRENKTLKNDFEELKSKVKLNTEKYNILCEEKSYLSNRNEDLTYQLDIVKAENKRSQNEIENKNKRLDEFEKGINFKIEQSEENGEYDIVIGIDSMLNLNSKGWLIKYPRGKEEYERKMQMEAIIIGVIGNRNKGKSFILQKLSDYSVRQGFSVVTEGLSLKYGEEKDHCIAILDSAGKESPLLNPNEGLYLNDNSSSKKEENQEIEENEEKKETKTNINNLKDEEEEKLKESKRYEICLRDKLITETYIQRFIIEKSHILVLVVGSINLNEQKLLENVKSLLKDDQYLYVIHNLLELNTKEQVNDYTEGTLKNLFGIKLKENYFQDNKGDFNQVYYVEEKNEKVTHLIYVNEWSSISKYYNYPTLNFLKFKNKVEQRRVRFSVVEECKKFLTQIGGQFIEEGITRDKFEIEDNNIIQLKKSESITLKKVFIDEIGKTQTNNLDQPRYSYYTEDDDKVLVIDIEVPGPNAIVKTKVEKKGDFYIFLFIGTKPYDQSVKDKKHRLHSNLKDKFEFKFFFSIPFKDITIGTNKEGKLNFFERSNKDGIFRFKYHIINGEDDDFQ